MSTDIKFDIKNFWCLIYVSRSNVVEGFDMITRARLRHKRGEMPYTQKSFYYQKYQK